MCYSSRVWLIPHPVKSPRLSEESNKSKLKMELDSFRKLEKLNLWFNKKLNLWGKHL